MSVCVCVCLRVEARKSADGDSPLSASRVNCVFKLFGHEGGSTRSVIEGGGSREQEIHGKRGRVTGAITITKR